MKCKVDIKWKEKNRDDYGFAVYTEICLRYGTRFQAIEFPSIDVDAKEFSTLLRNMADSIDKDLGYLEEENV